MSPSGSRNTRDDSKTPGPPSNHRCGTVAIIGRPNVGKSTLLNRFLGQKIAIVSPKPETTRDRLLGILTLPNTQLLFMDTPGIYRGPKTLLGKHQIQAAREVLADAEVLLLMTDANAGLTDSDRDIMKLLPRPVSSTEGRTPAAPPALLAINKVDRVQKQLILPQIDQARRLFRFREIFPISATHGDNVQPLLEALVAALPEGPALYPPDQVTDRPVRTLAQELIREKALLFTHEEVPHAVAVLIEDWRDGQETENASLGDSSLNMKCPREKRSLYPELATVAGAKMYIRATIYVERETQKAILIGRRGSLLKRIGQEARKEIETLAARPVFLDLWVKVAKDWRKDPQRLREFGYG